MIIMVVSIENVKKGDKLYVNDYLNDIHSECVITFVDSIDNIINYKINTDEEWTFTNCGTFSIIK